MTCVETLRPSSGLRHITCAVLLTVVSVAPAFGEGPWNVIDLGTLGGATSAAVDINDAGVVVGNAATAAGPNHAFIWTAAAGMWDLGTLGGLTSGAAAINRFGWVVGTSLIATGQSRAFLWSAATGMANLGTLGGTSSFAFDISDAGVVIGNSTTATGATHAFVWTAATGMVDLGDTGRDHFDGDRDNEYNQVVGGSQVSGSTYNAFLWSPVTGMQNLGGVSGYYENNPQDINNAGQIVGLVLVGQQRASILALDDGRLHHDSDAWWSAHPARFGLNDGGLIVGTTLISSSTVGWVGRAGATPTQLPGLASASTRPGAVNNRAVIVGRARRPPARSTPSSFARATTPQSTSEHLDYGDCSPGPRGRCSTASVRKRWSAATSTAIRKTTSSSISVRPGACGCG